MPNNTKDTNVQSTLPTEVEGPAGYSVGPPEGTVAPLLAIFEEAPKAAEPTPAPRRHGGTVGAERALFGLLTDVYSVETLLEAGFTADLIPTDDLRPAYEWAIHQYEITDKQLHSGLGVTESLLSGETLYSGDRLKLEVINTRYMFLREILQEYVEEFLFKPIAKRKGFVEKNEWGEEEVLYPRLSFTRLPLRDSQDTFDALLNLYQKGSISIDIILELFNIDPEDTRAKLERDMFTVNDALMNEALRGVYGGSAEQLINNTDVVDRITAGLKLKPKAQAPDQRF